MIECLWARVSLEILSSKKSTVSLRPSANFTFGSHPSFAFANEISGWRCLGSSCGSGWLTKFEVDAVSFRTSSASSRIVNSIGLPRLTGPVKDGGLSINCTRPSVRSFTKQNERVWLPSPFSVMGLPAIAGIGIPRGDNF